jgi:hypothetical protein
MKRVIIFTIALFGTIATAQAARDYEYDNVRNYHRTDADLQADGLKCGSSDPRKIGTAPYNACMLRLGWRVNGYRHFHVHHDRFGNPCKDVGGASVCSNLF